MPLLGRDTSVTGPFPKGALLLETLRGQEVLGRPYKFQLTLLSKEPSIEPDDVLGKPLAVGIQLVTGEERFFHGIVTDFAKVGTTHLHTRYAAKLRSTLSLFDHSVDHTTIEVEGNTMGLGLGNLVSLQPGPDGAEALPFWSEEDFGKQYLVVGATYSLSIDQLETGDVAGSDEPFKARYQLLDSHTQFRPIHVTRKPRMPGRQTALVVGPAGEEIWTDKLGRVMVHFDWDRLGGRNEKSTCWLRVSQAWAGAKWGAQYLPRIGQEVIVAFLDGDPDRPIITGSLYNADTMPPYELPANQTQKRYQEPKQQRRHGQQLQRAALRRQERPRRAAPAGREGHVHAGQEQPDAPRGREPQRRGRQ